MIPGTLTNLRAVERSDLDLIHAWHDDPVLMRCWGYGMAACSRNQTSQRLESWLADESSWNHPVAFIIETLSAEPCGLLILSRIEPIDRSCELSILLDASHRRQGIGSDVIETIVDVAFTQWNIHRVTVQTEAHNRSAQAFFAQNGFELEGRMREARYFDGCWQDILIFGRVSPDREESR